MNQKTGRLIGAVLLVSGTAIGAGMLALPVITSFAGFFPSLLLLFGAWAFLFATAYLLLDVNLSFPGEVNLISMVGRSLGNGGKIVCWITYLLLLYSLTAAYIAGSAPFFLEAASFFFPLPSWAGPLPLLLIFGFFVYLGTRSVDWINRILMVGLIATYLLLVMFLPAHTDANLLSHVDFNAIWVGIPLVITSFGFHIIIPTLTTYLKHDKKKLRLALFLGSFLPLVIYIIWELLVLGVVPIRGEAGMAKAWVEGVSSATPLAAILESRWVGTLAKTFSIFAIVTSFLGVSLSLSDFLTDGLKIKRFSFNRELSSFLTFFPPLFFVYAYPRGFIVALQFAGIFVAILLCILPALMARKLPQYKSPKKRLFLAGIFTLSFLVIALDVFEEMGLLKHLIDKYVQT